MLSLVPFTALQAQSLGGSPEYNEQPETHDLSFESCLHLDTIETLWGKLFSLHEMALRLRSLHGASESAAALRQSLQLGSLQVVVTAHRLQIYGWLSPEILAELMQSITVSVLVTDALVSALLIEPETTHSYALLRCNIQRALNAVALLRAL